MKPTSNQIINRSTVVGATITEALNTLKAASGGVGGGGGGDMYKSVYDPNDDGKVLSADTADSVPWSGVTSKPSTFTPEVHTQAASTISDSTAIGRSVLTAADASAARTAIGAGTGNGDVTTTGTQTISGKTAYTFNGEYNAGNSSTALTVNFTNGQKQYTTLTANTTLTLSAPAVGNYLLRLVQDATGGRTVAFSPSPKWVGAATQPAINAAISSETIVSVYYNGTSYYLGIAKVNA